MEEAVGYFLDLRLRVRGNPYATALVDRCLRMIARAATSDPTALAVLEDEVAALRLELETRFGPAAARVRH